MTNSVQPVKTLSFWYQALLLLIICIFSMGSAHAHPAPANPGGVQTDATTVRWYWDWVPEVQYYEVTVDGQFADFTRDPQYFSRNLWAGDHSMTVVAVLNDGHRSDRTATVKLFVDVNFNSGSPQPEPQPEQQQIVLNDDPSGGSVQAPSNPRGQEVGQGTVKWEWDWVAGAASYEVTVDGVVVGTTSNTNIFSENLWTGDHSLRLRAISGNGQYSGNSATAKIVVSSTYNPNAPGTSFIPELGESAPVVQDTASNSQPPPPAPQQPQNPANDNGLVDAVSWTIPESFSKPGYELVFSDEFNSASLNPVRWNSQLRWDGEFNGERYEYRVINNEDQFYVNPLTGDQGHKDLVLPAYNPFEFNGSRLAIRAIKNPLKLWEGGADFGPLYDM
nr:hypothetical protein [Gammaproteobacteria bacterium]